MRQDQVLSHIPILISIMHKTNLSRWDFAGLRQESPTKRLIGFSNCYLTCRGENIEIGEAQGVRWFRIWNDKCMTNENHFEICLSKYLI